MPSQSLQQWTATSTVALDELESAHRSIGGTGRGRRRATQQINYAYAMLLSAQFQGFCRLLHIECSGFIAHSIANSALQGIFRKALSQNRKLDRGNPNPSNIQQDFAQFGLDFWPEVQKEDARNKSRQMRLNELNLWRNAIAHQDFLDTKIFPKGGALQIAKVREWRQACNQLAVAFDAVMKLHISTVTGTAPW